MAEGRRGKKDSSSDNFLADIEPIIQKAVSAAVSAAITVLREEFAKQFDEYNARITEMEKALSDIGDRLSSVETSVSVNGTRSGGGEEPVSDQADERRLQAVQDEARQFMVIANDNEQHNRMNNLRIRGINADRSVNCRTAATEFIRSKLHISISPDDLEAAHPIPNRPATSSTAEAARASSREPTVIVRFWRRELRDDVLRNRRVLKGTPFSIGEDLTALNLKTLNRLRNSHQVNKTWSWNGRIYALLSSGRKIIVKPFQTIEQSLNNL